MINRTIREAISIFDEFGFHLPPFARWTPDDWKTADSDWDQARLARLGWDVTDFGLENFPLVGRVLFTLRNGVAQSGDKPYAEKIILGKHGQRAPSHYHRAKIEDIINRGGSEIVLRLGPPVDGSAAYVYRDGRRQKVNRDLEIRLTPGESLCIPPGVIHQFWGEATASVPTTLIGEVSSFCDDLNDNVFFEEIARFAEIVEDEPAVFSLCHELPPFSAPTSSTDSALHGSRAMELLPS
jgi:D-lyxose ketol-isomerase